MSEWFEITASDCSGYDPILAGYDDPVVGYVCSVCHEGYEKEVMGETTWDFCPNCGTKMDGKGINVCSNDESRKLSNRGWKEFLSKQFGISKTSAKEMLHGMMQWKKYDNFKRTFNPIKEQDDD